MNRMSHENTLMILQRAIVMTALLGLVGLGVVVQVRHELAVDRAALRDGFLALLAEQVAERAAWAEIALQRQAWADAERVCEEADRVEQREWPVRTKLLCRLLADRDAS